MSTDQVIQLPADSTTNKNLLRAFTTQVGQNAVLEQAVVLSDVEANVARVVLGALVTSDQAALQFLSDISDKLDILIDHSRVRS